MMNFRITNSLGIVVAQTEYAEDAAMLAGNFGNGSKVLPFYSGLILWEEGAEELSASESFDRAAEIMHSRLDS